MIRWQIVQSDIQRIRKSLLKILSVAENEKNVLSYNCAVDFKNLLFQNIITQKYSTNYAPYSPRYAEWKTQKMFLGSSFWRLFGDLLQNLSLRRESDGWFSGIQAGVYDSGGKSWFSTRGKRVGRRKPISMYASVMEFGLHTHPARPVFGPTTDEYAADGWKKRGAESLKRVGSAWK